MALAQRKLSHSRFATYRESAAERGEDEVGSGRLLGVGLIAGGIINARGTNYEVRAPCRASRTISSSMASPASTNWSSVIPGMLLRRAAPSRESSGMCTKEATRRL